MHVQQPDLQGDLRQQALAILMASDPRAKVRAARGLRDAAALRCDVSAHLPAPPDLPGRPTRPRLVSPARLPRRSPFTPQGRAALIHSVAHIEFNAINLACDAIWRFPGLPQAYYLDWARVACEEALHFSLLNEHLATLGHSYGDFDAHDGLWTMAERTAHDLLARLALVPRVLEARGLDATPPMQAKLAQAGDHRAVEILDVILRDEVGHVAVGNRWYRHACAAAGLDPILHEAQLTMQYRAPRPQPPFNLSARRAAGFDETEISRLLR